MRIYLIGAGVIARTHALAAAKLPEPVDLRAADPNPAALADFQSQFPGVPTCKDAAEMLNAETPLDDDIVIVATPPSLHLGPTKLALQSGRHVLCEKPLAMNPVEAEEMLRTAERHGRLLGCCSVRFKGMPHMEAVKRVIASGALGDIYHVTFVNKWERSRSGIEYQPGSRWFLDSGKSGGGVLMDWGPYDFATLNDILQPSSIEVAGAWTAKPTTAADPIDVPFDVETHVGAFMTFRGGHRPIHVHYERASCAHGEEYVQAEIEGTRGALRWMPFDSRQPVFLRLDKDGTIDEEQVETGPRGPFTIMDNPIVHFHRKVRGLNSQANTGRYAVDIFRCISALYECERTGVKQILAMNREGGGGH
ncbi:MAG TPA: Gfo/Idh/MocA family oxidoreductase [Paenibacillus sp.]|uniref:Gfo/Idh/MocA family protein n=1 Tax=Paenibacillus sp. TaxID=58172 RepID=UPI002BC768D9|nr:Gfo/Idh/MocA family oxidoreductase [Paenibacillus sp.]HUC91390.1 Gfo/Idh/MocA family oxidoreductase [Paenibacillus sp.]